MSFFNKVMNRQKELNTSVCLGLDPRENDCYVQDLANWGKKLIEQTQDSICCIKPNFAFYQQVGIKGIEALEEIISFSQHHNVPVILDAKYGDIGSTAEAYAKATFEWLKADAVTLNPYMGFDSIKPFLAYKDKGLFILCKTSNPSSADFQDITEAKSKKQVYMHSAKLIESWGNRCGLVVGATQPEAIENVRTVTNNWILAPGIGAQGGDIDASMKAVKENVIFPISRGLSQAADPKQAAKDFKDMINDAKVSE